MSAERADTSPAANAAAVSSCSGANTAPVSIRRGVTAAANRSTAAASPAVQFNTCRNNCTGFFAPCTCARSRRAT